MWETLLPNLVHITGIPLSETLFIGCVFVIVAKTVHSG